MAGDGGSVTPNGEPANGRSGGTQDGCDHDHHEPHVAPAGEEDKCCNETGRRGERYQREEFVDVPDLAPAPVRGDDAPSGER